MVEAFEAVLPQSILTKLEPFSFAICCKDGGYVICLQSFKALSDDVYHGPLTKYIDKNNWFGFVDDVKSIWKKFILTILTLQRRPTCSHYS